MRARDVEARLTALGDRRRAEGLLRFFKTGPGQYGEGDRFLGITMPQLREVERECRELPLDQVERLLESPWHECRTLAVATLAARYPRAKPGEQAAMYRLYLRRTDRINNWDLVDISAPGVVGEHLLHRSRGPLRRMAKSRSLWERRIAIVSTFAFIRRSDFADTLAISKMLLDDDHDLIHKAVGWMLREVGKRDEEALLAFLDRNAAKMPRTALRYALERLSPSRRKRYMAVPRRTKTTRR